MKTWLIVFLLASSLLLLAVGLYKHYEEKHKYDEALALCGVCELLASDRIEKDDVLKAKEILDENIKHQLLFCESNNFSSFDILQFVSSTRTSWDHLKLSAEERGRLEKYQLQLENQQ